MRPLALLAFLLPATALAGRGAGMEPIPLPDAWTVSADAPLSDSPWWDDLDQPGLTAAIEEALQNNLDLGAALDRIEQADAIAFQSMSALLPRLSFDNNISGNSAAVQAARMGFVPKESFPGFVYSGSSNLNASIAVDLFGANTLGWQASRVDSLAGIEDHADLAMMTAQLIAAAWLDAALVNDQIDLINQQLTANEQILELAELRFNRSEATAVDVMQQRQQIAAARTQLPMLEASRQLSLQRIAVLMGREPTELPVSQPDGLPRLPGEPGLGSPGDLNENRPDLRGAELRLTSSWQRRLSSERQFLPTLGLNFSLGWNYGNAQQIQFGGATIDYPQLFTNAFSEFQNAFVSGNDPDFSNVVPPPVVSPTEVEFGSTFGWSVGFQINFPIFDGGLTMGRLRQARATEAATARSVSQSRLNALEEVESARTQLRGQLGRLEALEVQATAARATFEASRERYAQGLGDYTMLLTALISSQSADLAVLQTQRDALGATILLRDALGGPWTRNLSGGSK